MKNVFFAMLMFNNFLYSVEHHNKHEEFAIKLDQKNQDLFLPLSEDFLKNIGIEEKDFEAIRLKKIKVDDKDKVGVDIFDTGVLKESSFLKDNLDFQRNDAEKIMGEYDYKSNDFIKRKNSIENPSGFEQNGIYDSHGLAVACAAKQFYPNVSLFSLNHHLVYSGSIVKSFDQSDL